MSLTKSDELTPREKEIVKLIASECMSIIDIANRLGLAPKTASIHKTNAMQKLRVHSVAELCRWWWTEGIIDHQKVS